MVNYRAFRLGNAPKDREPNVTPCPDPELVGHYVRVQPTGTKTFCAVARKPTGKQDWTPIGATDVMLIDEAREKAREIVKRVRAGLPAIEAKTDSVADVAATWIKRHVEPNGLRSGHEIRRIRGGRGWE